MSALTLVPRFRAEEAVRADYNTQKERVRALTIQRAKLDLDDDEGYRRLNCEIQKERERLALLERELASATGAYLTWACSDPVSPEHKYCRGEFNYNGVWMRCGCDCHAAPKTITKKAKGRITND
jgi:hypothetical protein